MKVLIISCLQWGFMALITFPHHPCSYALEYLDYFTLKFVYELLFEFSVYLC